MTMYISHSTLFGKNIMDLQLITLYLAQLPQLQPPPPPVATVAVDLTCN